jgi:vacuolar-type H+-ATPase subunit H
LSDLLNQGWQVPFSSYRMVHTPEVEQLLERMRINVPSSIRDSERTLQERDRILAEARNEADRLIQEARQQAVEMLSERSLVETAQVEAARIVEEGRQIARQRAESADAYTVQVLQDLAQRLNTMLQQVENGIQVMEEGRSAREEPAERRPRNAPRTQG